MNSVPLTIEGAAKALRSGELSSVEITSVMLERAAELDSRIGVYLHLDGETALAQARRSDSEIARGVDRGPLQGIPLGIKDILATKDAPTTAQSRLLLGGSPSLWYDADSVARLRSSGAVILGKTTTMEFAKGRPAEGDPFPIPRNAWNTDYWTGGSSSGTANGVAAGLFLGGLGTDTGGSVRLPAAFCGVTGFKPTYGKVSLHGVIPLAPSMDHVGPMARTAAGCGILFSAISQDTEDQATDWTLPHSTDLRGVRIGVDRQHHLSDPRVNDDVRVRFDEALAVLEGLGAKVIDTEIPLFDELVAASNVVSLVEAFTYHRRNLQHHPDKYASNTRRTLLSGATYLASDYARALQVIRYAKAQLRDFLQMFDVLAMPTTSRPADRFGELNDSSLIPRPQYTRPWNAVGFPGISVPMGTSVKKLPVGMQLVGAPNQDQKVLQVGAAFQEVTRHHLQVPPMVTGEIVEANASIGEVDSLRSSDA